MGAAQGFHLTQVHVRINLLGRPALQRGVLPEAHYWLHTIGLAVSMGGFAWGSLSGKFQLVPVAAGSSAVALCVLLLQLPVHLATRLRPA
jgi:hypothetical protein